MMASDKVQEVASRLQQLSAEEKGQLLTIVPSLWEFIPVETLKTALSQEEFAIRHGAEYRLNKEKQRRLSQLLEKNRSGILTPDEEEEMDKLIEEGEELTLLKAQTLYALKLLAKRLLQDAREKP